jgi:hypothetical protein
MPVDAYPRTYSLIVMRGLDPRIHLLRKTFLQNGMDCRVKPGNDGGRVSAHAADISASGKLGLLPPPLAGEGWGGGALHGRSLCLPPPYPSPASGGGDAPSTRHEAASTQANIR